MKLDKNGYPSERRDSFSTAVKVLTFIFGVGAVVAAVCVYAVFSGCGSGGSGDEPIYNGNGVCVENCSPDECPSCGYFDGEGKCVTANCASGADTYQVAGDSCNGDTCSTQPQYDTVIGACKAIKAGKKPPKVCTPKKALNGSCAYTTSNPDAGCFNSFVDGKICTTDAECQVVPCEEWPPEVCWGLPCQLVGKWQCPSGSVMDFTDMEFYDNGDGYCRMHFPQYPSGDLYNKPGDDHVQRPPSGEPVEEKYTILDNGNQLLGESPDGDGIYSYTCTKLTEEE